MTPDLASRPASSQVTTLVYAAALCLSAGLLFWIQPLLAKSLLPAVGGSPAIWHTVLVFFQTVLLLGYAYAHLSASRLPFRKQAILHLTIMVVALAFLPTSKNTFAFTLDATAPAAIPLVLWKELLLTIGLPCFLISSTAPLLQHWYSKTGTPNAHDPYFLYAASNLGSLTALLGFPLVAEPILELSQQFRLWSILLVILGILLIGAARRVQFRDTTAKTDASPPSGTQRIDLATALPWLGYAFLGSSMMLAATSFLATEVINAPQITLFPLALFIATYILAFTRRSFIRRTTTTRATVVSTLAVMFQWLTNATEPAWLVTLLHLSLVFTVTLSLHQALAASRPPPQFLTHYFLLMSLGGVIAGLGHTFAAPILFDRVWEYPLTLVTCAAVIAGTSSEPKHKNLRRPVMAAVIAILGFTLATLAEKQAWLGSPLSSHQTEIAVVVVLAAASLTHQHRILWATVIAALFAIGHWHGDGHGKTLFIGRNFYGISRVTLDPNELNRRLVHSNTIHGRESTDPLQQSLPLSYYHQAGPLRRIIKQYEDIATQHQVAVIGLGAGSMLFYGQPHQQWTLYELDPLVIQIARDTRYFHFLENPSVESLETIPGDARITLQHAPTAAYDLIVLDAFSGDSIPTHLFTYEALALYLEKLDPKGLLAFHISNRSLNLAPILARLAEAHQLETLAWNDPHATPEQGKDPSHWVALARSPQQFAKLAQDERWQPLKPEDNTRLWTDERSNLLEALDW